MVWSRIAAAAGGAAICYGLISLTLYLRQRRILYRPDSTPAAPRPLDGRLPQVLEARAADGVVCRHWYWPPPSGAEPGLPLVLLFHGNAGHLGDRVEKYAPLVARGCGLLLAGYRGYGGNPGSPSETGLLADGRAAADLAAELAAELTERRPLALYGESLGAALVVALAAEGRGQRLVLEAPFDSVLALARRRYSWLPVGLLLKDPWDSLARIAAVRQPLLWLHGTDDEVTPLEHGRRLFAAAPGPKESMEVVAAGHCDFLDRGEVLRRLFAFLVAGSVAGHI